MNFKLILTTISEPPFNRGKCDVLICIKVKKKDFFGRYMSLRLFFFFFSFLSFFFSFDVICELQVEMDELSINFHVQTSFIASFVELQWSRGYYVYLEISR